MTQKLTNISPSFRLNPTIFYTIFKPLIKIT